MPRPLHIGFNARSLSDPRLRGFARHTFELLKAMQSLEPSMRLRLFSDLPISESYVQEFKGVELEYSRVRPHLAWEQVALPWFAKRSGVQLLHATSNLGLPVFTPGCARVLTLHDLISVRALRRSKGLMSPARIKGALSFRASQRAALGADAIITVSEYSKQEILKDYPSLHSRVHVIHNGVDNRFSPGEPSRAIFEKHGLTQPYILYVGGFDERKNVAILSEALAGITPTRLSGFQVALAGEESSASPGLKAGFNAYSNVHWLGYVTDTDLIELYRGAACLVLPSRDEGFGLQVIEAMSCGTPVLLSNATSLPEVGGEAASYFDPDDSRKLALLIQRALVDANWAGERRQLGFGRAKKFSWRAAAEKTLYLYETQISRQSQ